MTAHTFTTPTGLGVPAVTTAQMREVDRVAVEEVGPTLLQMMENAGRNLAELCIQQLGIQELGTMWTDRPVLIAAGTGGNGGGGMCAARHLLNHGGRVTIVVTDQTRLTAAAAQQLALVRAAGGRVVDIDDMGETQPDLIVDAVLGYSLTGAPRGAAEELISWMESMRAPVVALDVPSGVDATTGEAWGRFVRATTTMTLALPKSGLDSPAVGRLLLADIGIPREVYRRVGVDVPRAMFTDGYRVALTPGAHSAQS